MTAVPLVVRVPRTAFSERQYAADVVLGRFLGLPFRMVPEDRGDVMIESVGGKSLLMPDVFFPGAEASWLRDPSLPKTPLRHLARSELTGWRLGVEDGDALPVVWGARDAGGAVYRNGEQTSWLGLDVFGTAFFLLTRYEEAVSPAERDSHDRFPARASLMATEGILHRPIVDEYVEIMWLALAAIQPGLKRRRRTYTVALSHDVDWPFLGFGCPWPMVMRQVAGDFLKRRVVRTGWDTFRARLTQNSCIDPGNTFQWLIDESDLAGFENEFYFIAGHTAGKIDGIYSVFDPEIQKLMKTISDAGHRIGLHPSYGTYLDPSATLREFSDLQRAAEQAGIKRQSSWGGRQHFLRWRNATTWQNWADAGLDYDSTVGFAEEAGFRCGTCHEYPVYNVVTRRPLKLLERPLVVMEKTVLGRRYMRKTGAEALDIIVQLAQACRRVSGKFTLLWHNTSLLTQSERDLYREVLRSI
jgi:hypothetical protein